VKENKTEIVRAAAQNREMAFTGIHVISPRLLSMMKEEGVFSILQTYLRLAGEGEKIVGANVEGAYWRDLGTPEKVARAARELATSH